MKKTRFTQEQIAYALRQAEAGTPVEEITRKMGVCEASFLPPSIYYSEREFDLGAKVFLKVKVFVFSGQI